MLTAALQILNTHTYINISFEKYKKKKYIMYNKTEYFIPRKTNKNWGDMV